MQVNHRQFLCTTHMDAQRNHMMFTIKSISQTFSRTKKIRNWSNPHRFCCILSQNIQLMIIQVLFFSFYVHKFHRCENWDKIDTHTRLQKWIRFHMHTPPSKMTLKKEQKTPYVKYKTSNTNEKYWKRATEIYFKIVCQRLHQQNKTTFFSLSFFALIWFADKERLAKFKDSHLIFEHPFGLI